ncbi:hypothetical protein MD484_g5402, partial [Candolleomyces efflorescens]
MVASFGVAKLISLAAILAPLPGGFSNITISRVKDNLLDIAKASWELGTAAQALTEVYTPGLSVFNATAFPPPTRLNSSWTPTDVFAIVNRTLRNKPSHSKALFANQGSAADPASLGTAVLLANWTRADKRDFSYNNAALSQLQHLLEETPRTRSGAISHRANEVQLWSDFVYMVPPFIAYYGALQNDRKLLQEAYDQCRLYRAALRDSPGLWRHIDLGSFTDDTHWATGNAWAAGGMLRVLTTLNHSSLGTEFRSHQRNLTEWIDEILVASWSHQGRNGTLFNVIDDPQTFGDTASTALLAAVTYRLATITHDFKSIPAANRALVLIQDSINANGWLENTVDPIKFHALNPKGTYSPEGQAFVLLLYAGSTSSPTTVASNTGFQLSSTYLSLSAKPASHSFLQDAPLVKEPLGIHVLDVEAGLDAEQNGHPRETTGLSTFSITSPNPQAPVPSATLEHGPSLKRRISRISRNSVLIGAEESVSKFWDRFSRRGKENVGVLESLRAIALSSWLNVFLVFVPIAWVSHFLHWPSRITFGLSFLAIIPLEGLTEWGGDQMALYLGKDFGDLLIVTCHNAVEATLAIILLLHCEISLLKATIIGVVILHLLLVPGAAFITGGARVLHQDLHPHLTDLNHSLLALGVLSLMLPAAFFAALRGDGEQALNYLPTAPEVLREKERQLQAQNPSANQYVVLAMLVVVIGIMAATAEWLVKSLSFAREHPDLQVEWFGLILLPLVSYAADGVVAIVYFVRRLLRHFFKEPAPVNTLAKGRAIDLSIQFLLFWMPFFVLLAWWTGRPLTLLFDFFEVAIVIGACFIVNYVTADAKTNWAEGATMVSFYVMIVRHPFNLEKVVVLILASSKIHL